MKNIPALSIAQLKATHLWITLLSCLVVIEYQRKTVQIE